MFPGSPSLVAAPQQQLLRECREYSVVLAAAALLTAFSRLDHSVNQVAGTLLFVTSSLVLIKFNVKNVLNW
jgi:hypothetical protein